MCLEAGQVDQARAYLECCLQLRKRAARNEEGITRAKYRYANTLHAQMKEAAGNNEKDRAKELESNAERLYAEVSKTVERYQLKYCYYMPAGDDNEHSLDQMVSIWSGRLTGGLEQVECQRVDLLSQPRSMSHRKKRRRLR